MHTNMLPLFTAWELINSLQKVKGGAPHGWKECSGCLVAWFQNYASNLTEPLRGDGSLLKMEIAGHPVTFES